MRLPFRTGLHQRPGAPSPGRFFCLAASRRAFFFCLAASRLKARALKLKLNLNPDSDFRVKRWEGSYAYVDAHRNTRQAKQAEGGVNRVHRD